MSATGSAILGISLIFACTIIGAALVFVFKGKEISPKLNQVFTGLAAGIMLSAAIFSLLLPAIESEISYMPVWAVVGIAVAIGAVFLWSIDKIVPHFHTADNKEEGIKTMSLSRTSKMFLAVTIHNIPEGLAVGIAYSVALATWTGDSSNALWGALILAIGIGVQNIPEGAVVALAIKGETGSSLKGFLLGVCSGVVEPIAAVVGLFLAMQIQVVMPWALAFAAGCMLYVIVEEMIPEMKSDTTHHHGVWAFIISFIGMTIMEIALG